MQLIANARKRPTLAILFKKAGTRQSHTKYARIFRYPKLELFLRTFKE